MRARLVLLAVLSILPLGLLTDAYAKDTPPVRLAQTTHAPSRASGAHVDWDKVLEAPAELERLADKAMTVFVIPQQRADSVISRVSRIVWSWISEAIHLLLASRFSN